LRSLNIHEGVAGASFDKIVRGQLKNAGRVKKMQATRERAESQASLKDKLKGCRLGSTGVASVCEYHLGKDVFKCVDDRFKEDEAEQVGLDSMSTHSWLGHGNNARSICI
jgi:hypothetical protein